MVACRFFALSDRKLANCRSCDNSGHNHNNAKAVVVMGECSHFLRCIDIELYSPAFAKEASGSKNKGRLEKPIREKDLRGSPDSVLRGCLGVASRIL